jgi:hypothetical protein
MSKIKINNLQENKNGLSELTGKELSKIKGGFYRLRVTIPLDSDDDSFGDLVDLFKFFDALDDYFDD